jgi:hypothetical protein
MVDWWFIPAPIKLVISGLVMVYKLINRRERLAEDSIPKVCSQQ